MNERMIAASWGYDAAGARQDQQCEDERKCRLYCDHFEKCLFKWNREKCNGGEDGKI